MNINCHRKKKLKQGKNIKRDLPILEKVDPVLHNF